MGRWVYGACCAAVLLPLSAHTQQQQPLGFVPASEAGGAHITGALEIVNGRTLIESEGAVTAGSKPTTIVLTRGGELKLCATSSLHLTRDKSPESTQAPGLLMGLDRGAVEATLTPGKFSDVLMTPDFRILISAPGQTSLKVRVNPSGDTCVDNAGEHAPYITVVSLFDNSFYRVRPGQRVSFENGSLRDVVDNEREPCGCPAESPMLATKAGSNDFPAAQSAGLAPGPALPTTPVVPPGQVHAEVTVPLSFDGPTNKATTAVDEDKTAASTSTNAEPVTATPAATAPTAKSPQSRGFFGSIGHFFSRIFNND